MIFVDGLVGQGLTPGLGSSTTGYKKMDTAKRYSAEAARIRYSGLKFAGPDAL
ncbi:MAG: hypothetical protein JWP58_2361 [Hymenobacter sp.]|nr:hypothetical protein [Hymenobacter sp.]